MRVDVNKAHDALMELSTFFRSSLKNGQAKEITLEQEKQHVDAYTGIESLRFPDKFTVNYQISVPENTMLPSFCLQIFVENAIRHAFKGRKTGNTIVVSLAASGNNLEIAVSDNGIGIDSKILKQLGKEQINETKGSGLALYNLNQRLIGLYGTSSELKISTGANGTTFKTEIPLKYSKLSVNQS